MWSSHKLLPQTSRNLPQEWRAKSLENFHQATVRESNKNLGKIFDRVIPNFEQKRKKDRKLILKYDRVYKKMKLKEDLMFKTLAIQMSQVMNSEREKHIFLKNNKPFSLTLEKDLKYYVKIKTHEQLAPLRFFIKNKSQGNYKVYISKKNSKPSHCD